MGVKLKAKFFIIFLSLFLCLSIIPTIAQKNDSLEELHKRVESLERERDFWKNHHGEQKQNISDQFDNKATKLENKFKEMEIDFKDKFKYVYIIGFLGIGGILTLIREYFKIKKKLKKIAEEKIRDKFDLLFEEKFNQLLEERKSRITKIIERANEEINLRNEKSILILSPLGADDSFLKSFFERMKFSNYIFKSIGEYIEQPPFDLIFLNNNEETKFKDEVMNKYISKTQPPTVCFYFGSKNNNLKIKKDTAFGNVIPQLYGNIIDVLRYQDFLKKLH